MNKKELIELLEILKENSIAGQKNTIITDVCTDSFVFVIDEAIEQLKMNNQEKKMNKLKELLTKDVEKAFKISSGNERKFYDYICCGSIIAFIDEHKGCFEIHGDTTTGKLFVLKMCIKQLSSDLNIPEDEIMDFLTDALKTEDRPF